MNTYLRIFWLLTLMLFTAGCSSYRMVGSSLDEVAPSPHPDIDDSAVIKEGDGVRLTLTSGEQPEGRVLLISPAEIVLEPDGRTDQPRGYPASQIISVEAKSGSDVSAGPILAVTAGVLVIGGVILYQAMADLRDGFMNQ